MSGHVVSPDEIRARLGQLGIGVADDATSAYAELGESLNLNAVAIGVGLDDIFYEPSDFPGLIYPWDEDSEAVAVLFPDGDVFITGAGATDVEALFRDICETISELELLDTDLGSIELSHEPAEVPVPSDYTGSEGWDSRSLFGESGGDVVITENGPREPDLAFAGEGDGFTDPFDVPGGVVFVEVTVDGDSHCDVTAVGQSTEDIWIGYVNDGGPLTHSQAKQMDRGTYILDIETDDASLSWEVEIFFTPPEPISLPYRESGHGDRVIGPIPHSGFIQVDITNYGDEALTLTQYDADLRTGNGSTAVDLAPKGQEATATKIYSTADDSEEWPWLVVGTYGGGEWEIEISAHD